MEQIIVPLDEAERVLSLQMALKCSDLSHTTAGLSVHLNWVSNLEEEVRSDKGFKCILLAFTVLGTEVNEAWSEDCGVLAVLPAGRQGASGWAPHLPSF